MSNSKPRTICVACSIFRSELESLRAAGEIDFEIRYLTSMLHMRPEELRVRLRSTLAAQREADAQVLLLYGDCHPHMRDHEALPGVCRVVGLNCPEILLGSKRYRELRDEGAFFLLPEWAVRWREIFEKELGLTGDTRREFMRELHTKLVYLDTGQAPVPAAHLQAASDAMGLPCEILTVGPEHLLGAIREAVAPGGGSSRRRSDAGMHRRGPAFDSMAVDLIAEALGRVDHPVVLGRYITGRLRELTGARTVVLFRGRHAADGEGSHVVSVDPERRRNLADMPEVVRLAELTRGLPRPRLWNPGGGESEAERILAKIGCGSSIAAPLSTGALHMGCVLLLDLASEEHGIEQIKETLGLLSTVIALTFRSAFVHEEQERIIAQRTGKLEELNDVLRHEVDVRKRAEKELQAKNTELEHFTRTVSHDLRSPLITIGGFLSLLERDAAAPDREQLRHDVERIRGAVDWMQTLLDGLQDLSRVGRLTNAPEPIALAELARDTVQRLAGAIAEHGVEIRIAAGLPVVFGDRSRLGQVLQNLIENAIKFTADQPAPRIDIEARQAGSQIVFLVRDNGVGIEAGDQSRIFNLFTRLDEKVGGAGIGLALVKRIVDAQGGRIWVESHGKGKGAAFCFTLPMAENRCDST